MSVICQCNMAPGGRDFFPSMIEWGKTGKNGKNARISPSHYFGALSVVQAFLKISKDPEYLIGRISE